ncbi:MAG: YcaO-like family protein, partial [Desulfobacterales bacterium]|nr:YcaO-like family protein [Desulfobacterales bacterium]
MTSEIVLKDTFKGHTLDQDKTLPPEETVRRLKARLAQLDLDILAETARIDNGRLDIPVFFSTCGKDALEVIGTKKQMGKGGTPQQAEASAVMELAERFSLFSFHKNPANFVMKTHAEVRDEALPFELIARSVHDDAGSLDIKERLFADVPMKWLHAWNMTRKRRELIPFDWFYKINEFNGSSAGNHAAEALSQGVCEVVERHVSSIVSRERMNVPGIRPDSVTDPIAAEMLQKYRNAGIRVSLSDFTLDTGIPTVGVLAWDPATFPGESEIV